MQNRKLQLLLVLIAAPLCTQAQWLNHPDANTPRVKDGKPNLSAPAPRLRGKPDLSGIWETEGSTRKELSALFPPGVGLLPGGENGLGEDDPPKYFLNILADYKRGEEPLTPSAAAELRKRMQGGGEKPKTLCAPPAIPVMELVPAPIKFIQTPGVMVMLYEGDTFFRQVYTDGRKHPVDPQPSWLGYSVGRWEGDTLVVDVVGLNEKGALDAMGHFHSDALHVTERFHRIDFGHMEKLITIEDPKVFTKPVTIKANMRLLPDTDLIESFCSEGESDLAHLGR
jgi:hypothetical protein